MAKSKKKKAVPQMRCPYCGRAVQLRPASYVYGANNLDPEGQLYVCNGYPNSCDAYVGVHKGNLRPKGTLANGELRHKRIEAHRALDEIWKQGCMTRHGAYIWLQHRLNLREKEMHIGKFSDYRCAETIRECGEFMNLYRRREEENKRMKNKGTQIWSKNEKGILRCD